jgi:Condensation domain
VQSVPLSFQQRFHWDNSHRLSDLNLNFPFALFITGVLNIARLRESFEAVIRRHGALRTRIAVAHGEPRQIVDVPGRFRLEVVPRPHDLTSEVEGYLNCPFDLVGGKLFRARLLRLSRREHILLVCAHHLIMDAYSVSFLSDELWHWYSSRAPQLPVLHTQYSDYALRQMQAHASWLESHSRYWTERLANAEPLRLPAERSLAVDATTSVGNFQIEFEGALTAAIDAAARRWKTMPAMLVLTAFIATLSRWSKQSDFIVPIVFSGRDDPDTLGLIGFFSYVLLLRMQIEGARDFGDLRDRVNREFCRACAGEDHGRVVTGLLANLPAREGMKLFSTGFNWLSMSSGELAGAPSQVILNRLQGELEVTPFPFRFLPRYLNTSGRSEHSPLSDVPALGLQVTQGSAVEASLLYSAGSLSPGSIAVFAENLRLLLESAVA